MKVVVFGGNSPIAISISKILAKNGVHVMHVTRNISVNLEKMLQEQNIEIISLDLEKEELAISLWTQIINSADISGIVFAQRYRGDVENFHNMFQCDIITPFKLIKIWCAHNSLSVKKLLMLTSPASEKIISSQGFPYHATKSAVLQLVKYIAAGNLGQVTSNAICPSSFVFKERAKQFYETNNNYFNSISSSIPSKGFTQVEEISIAAKFLMLDAPTSINGMNLIIDGGLSVLDPSNLMEKFIHLDSKF